MRSIEKYIEDFARNDCLSLLEFNQRLLAQERSRLATLEVFWKQNNTDHAAAVMSRSGYLSRIYSLEQAIKSEQARIATGKEPQIISI